MFSKTSADIDQDQELLRLYDTPKHRQLLSAYKRHLASEDVKSQMPKNSPDIEHWDIVQDHPSEKANPSSVAKTPEPS